MKYFIATTILLSAFLINACSSKGEKPQEPPVVTTTTVAPVPTTQPPTSGANWDASQHFCKLDGQKFNCQNPVWFGFKGCSPDSDGDGGAEGPMYIQGLPEIKQMAEEKGVAVVVKMKDGSEVRYGAGFPAPCVEM